MKNAPIIIGVILLILAVGYFATSSNTNETPTPPENISAVDTQPNEPVATEDTMNNTETEATPQTNTAEAVPEVTTGSYQNYNATQIAESDAEHILLFFHATWCPSCKALDADIVANADGIPTGVEIYKVDYDTATALKQQYGVTTQHSIIEISATGAAESGITHPLTLEGVLETI